MSLLNLLKTKKEAPKPIPKRLAVVAGAKKDAPKSARPDVLRRPHITEKAAAGNEKGVYVFEGATNATKREIAHAVGLMYKVNPVKVTIVPIPRKRITVKGRIGIRAGGKKAYVYLTKGEKIELI